MNDGEVLEAATGVLQVSFRMLEQQLGVSGQLARSVGLDLPVQVLKSHEGYYLGTTENGRPFTRESACYYRSQTAATAALMARNWPQKKGL